jgi:hypothetical protein
VHLFDLYKFAQLLPSKAKSPNRTLLVTKAGLEHAKSVIAGYKQGKVAEMNDELWKAKKIVDSTLHPGMHHCERVSEIY